MLPTGKFVLPFWTAVERSLMPTCSDASLLGSASTLTAYLAAPNTYLSDARKHGELLADGGLSRLIHRIDGQAGGTERDIKDGRVCRVYLFESWRCGQVGRKLPSSSGNGRLHIHRGAVKIAREIKLDGDAGGPQLAGRGHLADAGNSGELLFQ